MTAIAADPLRTIVARPTHLTEQLECGHIINRPLGLGEAAQEPSKAQRRRCYHCQPEAKPAKVPAKRKNPARTYSIFIASDTEYHVKHGNKIVGRFETDADATAHLHLCIRATP